MTHAYTDTDGEESILDAYQRVHANGEQTHVHITTAGDRYAVVAVDLDPRDYDAPAAEPIAYSPTLGAAREQARTWMEQHPKGVLQDAGGTSWTAKLWSALQKLDMSDQQEEKHA